LRKTKIVALIPTLRDNPTRTVESILQQTVKVSKIIVITGSQELCRSLSCQGSDIVEIIYVKPNMDDPLGKRIAVALNIALRRVDLERYNYILRVDADATLPRGFIEKNLKANADYVGKAGYAMLLKGSSFLKVFSGEFAEVCAEDSYVGLKFLHQGYQVKQWLCPPVLMRKSGKHHSYRYYLTRGIDLYRLGYEPIHVVERLLHEFRNIFSILGYALAVLKGIERYEFACWVFRTQLRKACLWKNNLTVVWELLKKGVKV